MCSRESVKCSIVQLCDTEELCPNLSFAWTFFFAWLFGREVTPWCCQHQSCKSIIIIKNNFSTNITSSSVINWLAFHFVVMMQGLYSQTSQCLSIHLFETIWNNKFSQGCAMSMMLLLEGFCTEKGKHTQELTDVLCWPGGYTYSERSPIGHTHNYLTLHDGRLGKIQLVFLTPQICLSSTLIFLSAWSTRHSPLKDKR